MFQTSSSRLLLNLIYLTEKSSWTKIHWTKNYLNTSKFTWKNVVYYIQLWSHFNVLSHIIQQNLAAKIDWILSLKFPTMQNFQMPSVNCLNIMLLLFTFFRSSKLHLQQKYWTFDYITKNYLIWAVSTISTDYDIIWYLCLWWKKIPFSTLIWRLS